MRRFQELTVAVACCGVIRGWFNKTTWPVCKLHEESRVALGVSPHRVG